MWRFSSFLAIGLAAAVFVACGSDSDSSDSTNGSSGSSSSEENDQDAAQVRLRQCLRENGVDVPDNPGQGGGGGGAPENFDREKLQEALDGPCKEYQTGAFGNISEEDRQEFQDSFQKFAQCMRDQGIDVPDMTAGEGPPAGGGGELDPDDPDVQAATEQCRDELPQRAPIGGGE